LFKINFKLTFLFEKNNHFILASLECFAVHNLTIHKLTLINLVLIVI